MKNTTDKQERIICAAIDIFATTGYAASNVPSIAKAADVSVGSIYHYFKNKQAILNAVFQHVMTTFLESISSSLDSAKETRVVFGKLFDVTINLIDQNTTALHFIYQNIFNVDLDEDSKHLRSQVIDTLTDFLNAGQKSQIFVKSNVQAQIALLTGSLSMMANFSWIGKNIDHQTAPDQATILSLKNQLWNGLTNKQTVF